MKHDHKFDDEERTPRQFIQVNSNGMLFINWIDSIDDIEEKKIAVEKIISNQLLINRALFSTTLH
jgi:hypothetical protein